MLRRDLVDLEIRRTRQAHPLQRHLSRLVACWMGWVASLGGTGEVLSVCTELRMMKTWWSDLGPCLDVDAGVDISD